ncbi:PhnD/SsuA/transferrin family substrate-binding protein [Roseovarius salis]|uniref:phosphate/phosphite/phosphonate ABC transporter substrate-binding protein n=1 Tax=Roseovarius salis TaxID=3376063 RepID=UPI0037C57167
MIASLPMYDRPELNQANDRLWAAVREHLGAGPERLCRGGDPWEQWQDPALVLSQTCGYPFRARLHGRVALVGTPDHGLDGCPPGYYRSVYVARADDGRGALDEFAGARLAYNEPLSQSGWAAPQNHARALGMSFAAASATGSHAASARAVADGLADIAALDAVSWKMMQTHDAVAAALKEVGQTPPTPALPYITATGRDANAAFAALEVAIAELSPADRQALSLHGIVRIPAEAYLAIPNPPPPRGFAGANSG